MTQITQADIELAAQDPSNSLEKRAIRILDYQIREAEETLKGLKFARDVLQRHSEETLDRQSSGGQGGPIPF